MEITDDIYFTGPERRIASKRRRSQPKRRYRIRSESLISDCRAMIFRRAEDEDGFTEITGLNTRIDVTKD